jgi:hypothetical protein
VETATQQDIDRLREDIGRTWADIRDVHQRHEDNDERRFSDMTEKISRVEKLFAEWSGALGISKWALGLGIPSIVGLLITHVLRHW